MKPGDIVLIRFPQADLKSGKLRPALIIAISPSRHRDLLLALISSRLHQATLGFDEIINNSDSDYSAFHVTEVSTSFANKGLKPLAHASF